MVARAGRAERGPRTELEQLRAAGLVHRASEQTGGEVEQVLPVAAALRPLFPGGCLRRGSTISIATAAGSRGRPVGSTSLLLGLLAEASTVGSWCAVVGLPALGLVAAAEAGVMVERLALVPQPGPDWSGVVAALLDGVDIVVAAPVGQVSAQITSRLAARARQRGTVLVAMGPWPGADLTLEIVAGAWHGLGQGRGRLRQRELEVRAHGRGAASRPRRAHFWLSAAPAPSAPSLPRVGHLAALPGGSEPIGEPIRSESTREVA